MQVVVVKFFSHTSVVPCTSTITHEAFGGGGDDGLNFLYGPDATRHRNVPDRIFIVHVHRPRRGIRNIKV